MKKLKFALIGAGFWSRYQLHGWKELQGVECVALCDQTRTKAEALAAQVGIPRVYANPSEMLRREELDFVDICTNVESHVNLIKLAADRGLPSICQKPLAPSYQSAQDAVEYCRKRGVLLLVNENWRWQVAMRIIAGEIGRGKLGKPWRAAMRFASSFPVFDNQPALRELNQFILTDVGTHLLDAVRFLFGEARSVYCQSHKINSGIRGEDAVSVLLKMDNGMTVYVDISYASRLENERFPQTYLTIEGEDASLELGFDYWIRVTDKAGTVARRHPPLEYPWANPSYGNIHASIVDTQRNLLEGLNGTGVAETTGEDNLKTLRLVYGCYESAEQSRVITV